MSDNKTPDAVAKAYERRAIEAEAAIVSLRREHADALEMARARARYAEDKHAAAIDRLRRIEEYAGLMRDTVEGLAKGSAMNAETVRSSLRLVVKAYDEGAA